MWKPFGSVGLELQGQQEEGWKSLQVPVQGVLSTSGQIWMGFMLCITGWEVK